MLFLVLHFGFMTIRKLYVKYEFKFIQFAVTEKIFQILMKGLNLSVNV
jgi:hypothetical protein